MALLLTIVWLGLVSAALIGCAVIERNSRLVARSDRPELAPPRAVWGNVEASPPSRALIARALAGFARLVRSQAQLVDQRPGLLLLGRLGVCLSLAIALAMVPFLGTWGGAAEDAPLVLLDLRSGLAAVGFVLLLTSFARVAIGSAERNAWSRIGSTRQVSRTIAALALLTLVFAPLAITAGSLRLHEIVLRQQLPIAPVVWLAASFDGRVADFFQAFPFPAWNVFTQPLTALLFIPAMTLLLGNPRVDDATTGATFVAGLGIDADPLDRYWSRLDGRLSLVLTAALFAALFLGAGSIPFFDPAALVVRLAPFAGETLPNLLVVGVFAVTFLVKTLLVIAVTTRLRRVIAVSRVDRALRIATRRLLPLAWANLLLVAASTLWLSGFFGSVG